MRLGGLGKCPGANLEAKIMKKYVLLNQIVAAMALTEKK